MNKNIIIQEGGQGKQLTAAKLKTALVGGGSCLWVPEDEMSLTTKHITEDGTYTAASEGYYGFSEVTVSGIGRAVGYNPDGNEAEVTTNEETGELETKLLPSSIKIITRPSKLEYVDNEAIDLTGIVVKGYTYNGELWEDENHPGGVIPLNELYPAPATVHYDPAYDQIDYIGHGINAVYVKTDGEGYIDRREGSIIHLPGLPNTEMLFTYWNNNFYSCSVDGQNHGRSDGNYVQDLGGGVTSGGTVYANRIFESGNEFYPNREYSIQIPVSTTDPTHYAAADLDATWSGMPQVVTLTWNRPGDGKALTAMYDVTVFSGNAT